MKTDANTHSKRTNPYYNSNIQNESPVKRQKTSNQSSIWNNNTPNTKNWSVQPIVTLKDPEPLNKDVLFKNVQNGDIIKKYFTHVSYTDFLSNLNKTWQEAAPNLKGKDYSVIGKFYNLSSSDQNLKSTPWVIGLLLKNNPDFQPKNIINIDAFNADSDKSLSDVVIVDDAAYSGQQMGSTVAIILEELKNIAHNKKVNIHLVIPYMSDYAVEQIRNEFSDTLEYDFNEEKFDLTFYSKQKINNIQDVEISETDKETQSFLSKELNFLTTFDHKIADSLSLGNIVFNSLKKFSNPVYKDKNNIQSFDTYYQEQQQSLKQKLLLKNLN